MNRKDDPCCLHCKFWSGTGLRLGSCQILSGLAKDPVGSNLGTGSELHPRIVVRNPPTQYGKSPLPEVNLMSYIQTEADFYCACFVYEYKSYLD
jgi:hypothetical protein